jgi:hypothetical protein
MYAPSSLEQLPSSPTITRPIVYKVAHTQNKTNKQQKQITKNNSNKQTNTLQDEFCRNEKVFCKLFTYQNVVRCSDIKMLSGVHISKYCQVFT